MNKTARIIYLIIGCIIPIVTGVLHTATHFAQLLSPEIYDYLQKEVVILGQSQALWKTWGMVSFMMGISFIVIGLLNTYIYRSIPKAAYPPVLPLAAMILYQMCVTYAGFEFGQPVQLYGGAIGMLLLIVSLVWSIKDVDTNLKNTY